MLKRAPASRNAQQLKDYAWAEAAGKVKVYIDCDFLPEDAVSGTSHVPQQEEVPTPAKHKAIAELPLPTFLSPRPWPFDELRKASQSHIFAYLEDARDDIAASPAIKAVRYRGTLGSQR